MMEAYIRDCERQGLKYDSIRLRLVPVMAAWARIHADYPERVKAMPKIKLVAPARREIECLDAGEVAILLDWLKVLATDLWPIACLQGLAGLRVLQAAALRRQDVDLEAGTVTITKTEHHTPKTRDSYRTIPVCGEVLDALRVAMAGQKIRPATGEIFTTQAGTLWVRHALTLRWQRTLKRAAKALFEVEPGMDGLSEDQKRQKARLLSIPARKLRAAFATMAGWLNAQDRIVKAYLGHSSGDMLGGHYRKIKLDELRAISGVMEGWREVIQTVDARKDSGNISPIEEIV